MDFKFLKKYNLKNLKMGYKLNMAFFLIILTSLITISVVTYSVISDTLVNQAVTSSEQIINETGEKVNLTLKEIDRLSIMVKNNIEFGVILNEYDEMSTIEQIKADVKIKETLTNYFSDRFELADVYFIRENKDYTSDRSYLGILPGYSFVKDNEKYKEFLKSGKNSFWTESYVSDHERTKGISPYVITLFKKINNYQLNNEELGTLMLNVKEKYIYSLLEDINFNYENWNLFIIDMKGNVVEETKKNNLLGKKLNDPYIKEMINDISENNKKTYSKLNYDIDGKNSLLTYSSIENSDWIIVGTIPMRSITNTVRDTYFLIALIEFIVLIMGLLLSRIITKDILNGVNNLVKNMNIVKSGNLKIDLDNDRGDELGIITDNFIDMVKKIKEIDKLKDEFLSNTSHELRTPINGIIGLSESLLNPKKYKLTNDSKRYINMILSSGKRLSSLIDDILDYSKLKSKDIKLNILKVDLRQVVDSIINVLKVTSQGKSIEFINDISYEFPYVSADEKRIQQILYNLIGNAIKFTEKGHIKIYTNIVEKNSVLCVEDTGIGIPKDKLKNIFESFEQVDNSISRQFGGTGLGLSITKKLVELHNGEIWVESSHGLGSKFYFSLPVFDGSLTNNKNNKILNYDEIEETDEIYDENEIGDLNGELIVDGEDIDWEKYLNEEKMLDNNSNKTILVIDDEPINLQVLKNHLSSVNYNVETEINGYNALKKLNNKKYDLIMTDVMMPKISGFELCIKIREKFSRYNLPIIVLTAKGQAGDIVKGFKVGANDYILKPFRKEELLVRVKTQLEMKENFDKINLEKSKI
jgi:signal transduction histidine kinase/CheY-like chemotaxis protein